MCQLGFKYCFKGMTIHLALVIYKWFSLVKNQSVIYIHIICSYFTSSPIEIAETICQGGIITSGCLFSMYAEKFLSQFFQVRNLATIYPGSVYFY